MQPTTDAMVPAQPVAATAAADGVARMAWETLARQFGAAGAEAAVGLGRIVALYYRSSASYRNR
jgi:hypothetical protein